MKTQQLFSGFGSVGHLRDVIREQGYKHIFLVTNNASYAASGAQETLEEVFSLCGCEISHFSGFAPNPQIEDVCEGVKRFLTRDFDAVVAVGGGSAMDMAKLINVLSTAEGDFEAHIKQEMRLTHAARPLIAIPTTSGSGSEATHFAVVYIGKTKYSLAYDFMLPDVAIVDGQFTANLPAVITAYTGMDALCQAVESYWCIHSTDESKAYAAKAIELVLGNLETCVNAPDDASRQAMAQAAYDAGRAINITKTTAPHAISYPLTSYYHIPHGHAVALSLGDFLVFNYGVSDKDTNDTRGAVYVRRAIEELCSMMDVVTPVNAKKKIEKLMCNIGLETDFELLGVDDIGVILNNVNTERLVNNPRKVDGTQLMAMLEGKLLRKAAS